MGDLSFKYFAEVARSRAERWFPINDWSGSDWATALAGETGEVCDVIKKLNRADLNKPSHKDPPREILMEELGNELADVMTYANLLAHRYGIDLAEATAKKFNAVSEREGFPERIELTPDPVIDLTAGKHGVDLVKHEVLEADADLTPPMSPPTPHPRDLDFQPRIEGKIPGLKAESRPDLRLVESKKATKKAVTRKGFRKR